VRRDLVGERSPDGQPKKVVVDTRPGAVRRRLVRLELLGSFDAPVETIVAEPREGPERSALKLRGEEVRTPWIVRLPAAQVHVRRVRYFDRPVERTEVLLR
jgi:hypothetical protein